MLLLLRMKPLCHWTAVARQGRKWRSARYAVLQHCCLGWNISFSPDGCWMTGQSHTSCGTRFLVKGTPDLLGGTKRFLECSGLNMGRSISLIALWLISTIFLYRPRAFLSFGAHASIKKNVPIVFLCSVKGYKLSSPAVKSFTSSICNKNSSPRLGSYF